MLIGLGVLLIGVVGLAVALGIELFLESKGDKENE